jgi:predicted tellurium resistance membrane protein TerC
MLFVTNLIRNIIHKHPILKKSAYLIIGLIGLILVLEASLDVHITELVKFLVIAAILISSYIFSHHRSKKVIGNIELIP